MQQGAAAWAVAQLEHGETGGIPFGHWLGTHRTHISLGRTGRTMVFMHLPCKEAVGLAVRLFVFLTCAPWTERGVCSPWEWKTVGKH